MEKKSAAKGLDKYAKTQKNSLLKKHDPWEGFAVSYVPGIANLKMRLGNKATESRKQGV